MLHTIIKSQHVLDFLGGHQIIEEGPERSHGIVWEKDTYILSHAEVAAAGRS